MATVGQDIFKPTKFGGKYTVTLIPGTRRCALRNRYGINLCR